ncbi:MAG: cell division control protein Cdc6, partial [Candidatus Nitrosothermus koennekii]
DNCVSHSAINLCAAIAGSEHGDARRAVDLLRVAGEVAEREGADIVEEKHVRIAEKKIEQDKVIETLRKMPIHEKLVMCSIMLSNNGTTGDIYNKYKELANKSGLEPVTQRRVGMMISELDMQGLISAPVINKGRYGRTKKITLAIQPSILRQVISEDQLISSII